jgi:hypothetical protein
LTEVAASASIPILFYHNALSHTEVQDTPGTDIHFCVRPLWNDRMIPYIHWKYKFRASDATQKTCKFLHYIYPMPLHQQNIASAA